MKLLLTLLVTLTSPPVLAEKGCPFGSLAELFAHHTFGYAAIVELRPTYTPGTINLVQHALIDRDTKVSGRYRMTEVTQKNIASECTPEDTIKTESGLEFCKSNSRLLPDEFFLVRVKNDCWIGYPDTNGGRINLSQRILEAQGGDSGNILYTRLSLSSATSSDDTRIEGTWTTVGRVKR
jgi:hypothetical protein